VSVAISTIQSEQGYDFWRWLSEYAELPSYEEKGESKTWQPLALDAARIARAKIWAIADESLSEHAADNEAQARDRRSRRERKIEKEVEAAVNLLAKGERAEWLIGWRSQINLILWRDRFLTTLPTKDGVVAGLERLEEWWNEYHGSFGKAEDIETAFALTKDMAEFTLHDVENTSDKDLAVFGFLKRLRERFPDAALTTDELRAIKFKRRIRAVGELFAAGFSEELKQNFFYDLDRMADGSLAVPCNGDAKAEAVLTSEVWAENRLDKCKIAAALLLTAQAIYRESPRVKGLRIHPIHGYELAAEGEWSTLPGKLRAVAPGFWRLAIEGEQYILTCELWPRPVVMSPNEFGRARGSANAILRDVGIAVDSPPGHWKAVWESHGLRNQLLATAERIDPRVRIEEFKAWIRRIALGAPAADRPPANGAAVRLADGATVASRQWLIEQAMADGIVRPHEEAVFEQTLRQSTRETNRRNANRVQQRLLTIDAVGEPARIPYIDKGASALMEKREEA
jgi:hypothetical protein